MKSTALSVKYLMSPVRRLTAICAVVALLGLAFAQGGPQRDRLSLVALVAIGFATALGWAQLLGVRRPRPRGPVRATGRKSRRWLIAAIATVLVAGIAVQSWFRVGTTIGTGDIKPPDGLAWLGRLFDPWAWTGSNLGEPSQLPLALPWAVVLGVVHSLGGNAELAQRIWYTALFVGAGLGAFGLLAALRLGPIATAVGATVYIFNPYVVSVVNVYPEYIAALGLLAAMPALVLAAGSGYLSVPLAGALLALSAPVLGYVDFNPPLAGMVLGITATSPLVSGWLHGGAAAKRSLLTLVFGIPLLLAASSYWIVPAILHLQVVANDQLASVSTWSWTEARATIGNALWLNTYWGWSFQEYFPYATAYDEAPLSVIRYVLPAIAFASLAIPHVSFNHTQRLQRDMALRLVVAAATGAVVIIFVSTGTNSPGNLVFDVLYRLPFGWLLREPGRFLMVAALSYSVMVAVLVHVVDSHTAGFNWKRFRYTLAARLNRYGSVLGLMVAWLGVTRALDSSKSIAYLNGLRRMSALAARPSISLGVLATVACVGFPIYTGALVPDVRPVLPSAHVRVPGYWSDMARYADALPTRGSLLIMPPDDFYQMPYTWGYYGTDDFIVDLFHRPVLVPNGQGYSPATAQVVSAVSLTARSITQRNWHQTQALVTALDTPLILLRRDIKTPFSDRAILPPGDLAAALSTAPNFVLVRTIGSLDLFALKSVISEFEHVSDFVTVNSMSPDLRLLSLLPHNAALVSSQTISGVPNVDQAPQLELWQQSGDKLVWHPPGQRASRYRIADLSTSTVVALDHSGTYTAGLSSARISYAPNLVDPIEVSVTGREAISNGDFAAGLWGRVADCHDVLATQARPGLSAVVVANTAPGGFPALRLSSQLDSACESKRLDWHGGSLVLSLMVHSARGNAPRICLWEVGPERCASIPSLPESSRWSVFRTSLTPDLDTTAIDIFLYADGEGTATVAEYAAVQVIEVPALPSLALLVDPTDQPMLTSQLVVLHASFSDRWKSTSGTHVVVDGMLNGWLTPGGTDALSVRYASTNALQAADWVSLATLGLIILISAGSLAVRAWRGQRSETLTRTS